MKRVLITGKNSYVGTNVEKWLMREPDKYNVEILDMRDPNWKEFDFSKIDVIFHVAGLVHQKDSHKLEDQYYSVNRDLPIELAKIATKVGVKQFIFMSSMAVYGQDGMIDRKVILNKDSVLKPKNFYAKSKAEAEKEIVKLNSDSFKVVILRPPMIYGPNCPGNYSKLEKIAKTLPIFPLIDNERSILNIDKMTYFVKEYIDQESFGLFLPQDDEYISTSQIVKHIANKHGKSMHLSKTVGCIIKLLGKKNSLLNKVFGNLIYEK